MGLTELLRVVETSTTPLTCGQLADRLGMDTEVVLGMLDWLARSQRLHVESSGPGSSGPVSSGPGQVGCDPSTCVPGEPCGTCPLSVPDTGRRFRARRSTPPGGT